jgi:23S rRNA (uracil1939-C5)-methyltransferase
LRRRAGLHGLRTAAGAVLGYREGGATRVVDLSECPVLHPQLAALIAPLRKFVAAHGPKAIVGIDLTLADQGVEASLSHFPLEGLGPTEAALDFAREQGLARLSFDSGYGAETMWEPEPVTVTLAGVPVSLPPGAFLQATQDAEHRMAADAAAWLGDARMVADLFAGLGTFAFALKEGRKVLAVEAEQAAHLACKTAGARSGGQVLALHRDLFRAPFQPTELNRFDAVLLDPPRAGARAQIAEIAASTLARVVYVSCNPSSWARDAAVLAQAGFRLAKLRPVGQFRWSTHVELVSLFER